MIFLPDTNFLLHFKDPADIPWAEITTDSLVRLVICGNTLAELDKKKFELRGRPQDRARKWAAIVRELIETDVARELHPSNPKISVEVYLEHPPGWAPPADLDVSVVGDDRFVADALAFQHFTNVSDCTLLTADAGPLWKGKKHGLRVISPMRPGWELAQETDSRDKEIRQLQQELKEARQGPAIVAAFTVDGKPASEITIEVARYPALSNSSIEELLEELKIRHPRVTEFARPIEDAAKKTPMGANQSFDIASLQPAFEWVGPTSAQIDGYNASYDRWLDSARRLAETAPASMQEAEFEAEFDLSLSNAGVSAAEDVWVAVRAKAGLLLREQDEEESDAEHEDTSREAEIVRPNALGPPPSPPVWKKVYPKVAATRSASDRHRSAIQSVAGRALDRLAGPSDISSVYDRLAHASPLDALRSQLGYGHPGSSAQATPIWTPPVDALRLTPPKPRDPEAFYWRNNGRALLSESWEFDCALFRHKIEPEVWSVRVVVRLESVPPNGGSVQVTVHARNLQKPLEKSFPVRIHLRDEDTKGLVRSLLPL